MTPLCWTELSEVKLVGRKMIHEVDKKVKFIGEKLKQALDCQKSYANLERKEIKIEVGEKVFFKVSLWKRVICLHLSLWNHMRCQRRLVQCVKVILTTIVEEDPKCLSYFNITQIYSNPSHVFTCKTIEIQLDLSDEEEFVKIFAREVKVLRKKIAPLIKVLWHNHVIEEMTWETKEVMWKQYAHLFDLGNFEDEIF